jgi:hypothetical protein
LASLEPNSPFAHTKGMKQLILAVAAALMLAASPAAGHSTTATVHIKMFAFNPASVTIH